MKIVFRYSVLAVVLCFCTFLFSCNESSVFAPNREYAGEPPQIYGARWVAESLVYQGKDYSALGEGKQYMVEFMPSHTYLGPKTTTEGTLTGVADCNTFSASFTVNNQTGSLRLADYSFTTNPCDSFSLAFTRAIPEFVAFDFPQKDLLRVDLLSAGYITFRRVLNPSDIMPSSVNPTSFKDFSFPPGDVFDIRTITINGDTLRIDVHYKGCFSHAFTLWADNTFTNAAAISTYLHHDANGDTCTQDRVESLFFSLAALRDEYTRVTGRERGELRLRFSAGQENITVVWDF